MTPLRLPSNRVINLETVTWAERATWVDHPHSGERYEREGVIVHFISGTQLRLTGSDAIIAAKGLGL